MHYRNKVILKILCFSFLLIFSFVTSIQAVKQAAIVMCAETGIVHHEQNPDVITYPASLTKMMTLYLTFKALREQKLTLSQEIPVSKHASKQSPCKLWLKPGSKLTVKQAILGVVTKSANDAAVVLAEILAGGSEQRFALMMTEQARKLGMSKTVFKNASGLPNKHQVTTARDMATLSRALYKDFPEEFAFFKEQTFKFRGQVHANHNHLLGNIKGVDGIKTGFINASGFNLAASMVRDNKRIIAVVMGGASAKSRDKKMVQLLESTHKKIKGKPQIHHANKYNSMGDLIHTVDSTASLPAEPIEAAYYTDAGQIKQINQDFESLDDLISVIEVPEKKTKVIKIKTVKTKANKQKLVKANAKKNVASKKKLAQSKNTNKKNKKRRNLA